MLVCQELSVGGVRVEMGEKIVGWIVELSDCTNIGMVKNSDLHKNEVLENA